MAGHYPCDVSRLSAFVAAGLISIAATAAHADVVSTSSLSTRALHLNLDVAGLITDVVLAHSDSMLDCTQ